jgi:hypothetical protein
MTDFDVTFCDINEMFFDAFISHLPTTISFPKIETDPKTHKCNQPKTFICHVLCHLNDAGLNMSSGSTGTYGCLS